MLPEKIRKEILGYFMDFCTRKITIAEISRRTGIHRNTIKNMFESQKMSEEKKQNAEDLVPRPHGPHVRCQCGRLVQMPCLACWLEDRKKRANVYFHLDSHVVMS